MKATAQTTDSRVGVETESNTAWGEQMGWSVVEGRKGVGRVTSLAAAAATLREGTTGGAVLRLSQVWAVAAPAAPEPAAAMNRSADSAAGISADTLRPVKRKDTAEEARGVPTVQLAFYRKYTEALLRRYVQMTMEAGRVPSMMGRPVLGGRASNYRIHGFDDAVNFRLDVERCLVRLEPAERDVIRRIAMQEYTQAEAAPLLGICLRTCVQRYARSLDRLTAILLETRLLEPQRALSSGRR